MLGEVYFVTSSRMNLGKYQPDGVICDLAPHDISILLYCSTSRVTQVSASARSIFREHNPEVGVPHADLRERRDRRTSRSPGSPRARCARWSIVGSKRMVQYDDTAADESVRVFDRGMEVEAPARRSASTSSRYRSGDIVVPRVEAAEPLGLELQDFARAIRTGSRPRSHARARPRDRAAIEAAETSLRRNGEPVARRAALERAAA